MPPTPAQAEAAIERALAQTVEEFDFDQTPLIDVMAQLNRQYRINVVLDGRALEQVNVDPSTTMVTMSVRGISLRSALDLLLDRLGLTWTIRSEVLLITAPEVAADKLITRVYDVADLVLCRDETGVLWDDYDSLIQAIEDTIEPDSWTDNRGTGPGQIAGGTFGNAHALVVLQTYPIQCKVVKLLEDLRNVGAAAGSNQSPPRRSWPRPQDGLILGYGGMYLGQSPVFGQDLAPDNSPPDLSALYGPYVIQPPPAPASH